MRLRIATLDEKFELEVNPFWPISRLNTILHERLVRQASRVKPPSKSGGKQPSTNSSLDEAKAKTTHTTSRKSYSDSGGSDSHCPTGGAIGGDGGGGENTGRRIRIRLVYQGRLLEDFDSQIGDVGMTDGSVLHCMVSKVPLIDTKSQDSSSANHSHRGFSLLDSAGYSFDEIEALRLTYFPHVEEFARTRQPVAGEDPHDRWYRLEEEWMHQQAMNPNSEFSRNAGAYAHQIRRIHSTNVDAPVNRTGDSQGARGVSMPDGFPSPHAAREHSGSIESQLAELRRTYTSAQIEQQLQQRVAMLRPGINTTSGDGPEAGSNSGRGGVNTEIVAPEGTIGHFCLGFVLGFLLGIIMVFWLWERRLPRRQKMGILAGMSLNLILQFYDVESDQNAARNRDKNLRGSLAGGIENQTKLSLRDGIKPSDQLFPLSALNNHASASDSLSKGDIILG